MVTLVFPSFHACTVSALGGNTHVDVKEMVVGLLCVSLGCTTDFNKVLLQYSSNCSCDALEWLVHYDVCVLTITVVEAACMWDGCHGSV